MSFVKQWSWPRVAFLVLITLFPFHIAAQDHNVTFELIDGNGSSLHARIEENVSRLLTAFNTSFNLRTELSIPSELLSEDATLNISLLWGSAPFEVSENRVYSPLIRTPGHGIKAEYEVRGIPLVLEVGSEEEGILLLNEQGAIIDMKFGIQEHLRNWINTCEPSIAESSSGSCDAEYQRRAIILDHLENYRTAYNLRDLIYIERIFSNDPLIIVGRRVHVSNQSPESSILSATRFERIRRSKVDYLANLSRVFRANEFINVIFDNVDVFQHPTRPYLYGVTVIQRWISSTYSDEGCLFLVFDLRDEATPVLHVRTWSPPDTCSQLGDFDIY